MSNNCLKTSHSVFFFFCLANKKETELVIFNQSVSNCDNDIKRSLSAPGFGALTGWCMFKFELKGHLNEPHLPL